MPRKQRKTALVLAGGGIMGAAYEIGALTALDRMFSSSFSINRFDTYLGISAGSIIATLMANRIRPADLYSTIARDERQVFNWNRKDIYKFDLKSSVVACFEIFTNLFKIIRHHRKQGWKFNLHDFIYILQEQFPSGLFSLDPLQSYLCAAFSQENLRDHFDDLKAELYIPAYDLDRGERVIFGSEGHRDCHICQAITASCAIPYFFRPYRIGNSDYIDGSTGKVLHLDIAIENGAELIIVINPRVPIDNDPENACLPDLSYGQCSSVADLGLNFSWEQSRRIEAKENIESAVENYRSKYPKVEIVLFEPGRDESLLFFQNPMSMVARNHIMAYGYTMTQNQLKSRFAELEPIFKRKGFRISDEYIDCPPPVEISP
jgi:predicted acylesterase/phospholipase RssA